MKVVLLKDLKGKGKKGDVIDVNSGYASNFLIPNGYAKIGNAVNLNEAKQAHESNIYQAEQIRLKAVDLAKKLEGVVVTLPIKCGANGKVFGSVTNKEIGAKLEEMGYNVDKKKIEINTIKNIGTYTAKLKLHSTVLKEIEINVIPE